LKEKTQYKEEDNNKKKKLREASWPEKGIIVVERRKHTYKIPINVKPTLDPCLWQPERRREIVCAEVCGGDG
jgi:hypothetical protein